MPPAQGANCLGVPKRSDAPAADYLEQAVALYWQLKEAREVDALESLLREMTSRP